MVSVGIRLLVPLHAHWWFVPGHLYLGHVQHDTSMSPGFLVSLALSVLFLLAALKVNGGASGRSTWSRVAVACLVGTAGRALRGRLHGGSAQRTESVAIPGWYTGPRG